MGVLRRRSTKQIHNRKIRIIFITQDDVFYLPQFFSRVLSVWADETAAIVILAPTRSLKTTVRRFYTLYGPWHFLRNSACYTIRKLGSRLGLWVYGHSNLSVAGVAGRYDIPVYRPASVNDQEFIERLHQDIRPDLIVSVAASQILHDNLLAVPRLGCVNIHSALLPQYRGLLPSFWTLLNGETEGGVTVHYISAGIDDGPIIAQRRFLIKDSDTVDSAIQRSKAVGAELLVDVLGKLKQGKIMTSPNNPEEGTYYSFPTRQDVRRLNALGRRVM